MRSGVVKRKRELEEENQELLRVREALEKQNAELEAKLKHADLKREYLEFQIEKLRRMLFGKRSEKIPARSDDLLQLEFFEEAKKEIETEEVETETITYDRKKRRQERRPIPEDIHREQVIVDVDSRLRVCPDCGDEMECFGHDVCEELEYIPALLYIIEYVLKKYACKRCESAVVQAPRPPRPIPKARPGPGLLAYILVSKYQDHLPLHRQERIFGRHGMELSRKTLCDWVQKMAELLQPIVEAMKRTVLSAKVVQVDETPVRVNNPEVKGKAAKAYIWTYGIPDEEVVYDFTQGRSASGPEEFFGGKYPPYLQSDSYSVYTSLDEREKTVHVGCWAHARRKYYEARAEAPEFSKLILTAIQTIFRVERVAKSEGLSGEALVARRREESAPILENLKELLDAKRPDVLPESGLGEAIAYTLNNWKALNRYIEIPEAEPSNNSAERSLRGVVVGRKNWLFVGHPNAGPRAANILSLVETCRRLGVEPYAYLKDVIAEMAKGTTRPSKLTPRAWRDARAKKAEKPAKRSDG